MYLYMHVLYVSTSDLTKYMEGMTAENHEAISQNNVRSLFVCFTIPYQL